MNSQVKKYRTLQRVLRYIIYLLAGLLFLLGLFIVMVLTGVFGKLPNKQEFMQIQNPMATEVYTADGVLMGTYYIQNRQYLEPAESHRVLQSGALSGACTGTPQCGTVPDTRP